MKEIVKIAHPLREITLEYDRSKPELPCEKEIVAMLLLRYDYLYEIKKDQDKLLYELRELEDELDAEAIRFKITETDILTKHKEISFYATDKNNVELMAEAKVGYLDLLNRIMEDQETIITPLQKRTVAFGAAMSELHKRNYREDGFDGVDEEEFSKKDVEVAEQWENGTMDCFKFEDADEALKEEWHSINIRQKEANIFVDKHIAYNEQLKITYGLSEEIKSILTNFQDREDVLNCSISESYANGTGDLKKRPFYIISPEDPRIKAAKQNYGAGMGTEGIPQITFNTSVKDVRNLNANGIVEQLALLQHFPALLEKLVFTCYANVVKEDGTILKIEELRGDPLAMEWYSKFRALKCSMFFFESRDVRAYIQIGDMKFEKADIQPDRVGLTGDNLQEVCQRLYDACHFFMVFCHNTGFDPIPYIDSILAESGLPIPLEEVIADFNEDLASGDIKITSTLV